MPIAWYGELSTPTSFTPESPGLIASENRSQGSAELTNLQAVIRQELQEIFSRGGNPWVWPTASSRARSVPTGHRASAFSPQETQISQATSCLVQQTA